MRETTLDTKHAGTLETIAKHFENLPKIESRTGQPSFQRDVLMKISGKGLYDDALGNCTTLLVDFPHVFQNFQPSETLAILLSKPDLMQVVNQYGGPMPLLQKIVSEMKVRCNFYSPAKPLKTGEICYFLRFRFPFDFEYKILNCAMVNGVGPTKFLAKNNAAIEGLELLRNLFLKEKFHSYNRN
ncbi:unnamed protein product [Orchesella dallaii]|uniref:DRBM domain-containing protein n=1 Tax=Orchesella dallaii TaxID=48710 RepID=A0ABP1S594_9HEXA